jgi:putative endonuclease
VVRVHAGEQIFKFSLKMWQIYILLCDKQFLYTGLTNNLVHRLKQHQNYQSTFTKQYKEIKLVYSEKFSNRSDAVAREKEIKGWNKQKKLSLIKLG